MKYKKLLFFTLLLLQVNVFYTMQRNNLSIEDAQEIANKINRVRNDAIETWTTDMSDLSDSVPCSPAQTTARHILLLHENSVIDAYQLTVTRSTQVRWIDKQVRKIQEQLAADTQ